MSVVLDYRHKYISRLLITQHSSKQARQSADVNKKPATINIRSIGNPPNSASKMVGSTAPPIRFPEK